MNLNNTFLFTQGVPTTRVPDVPIDFRVPTTRAPNGWADAGAKSGTGVGTLQRKIKITFNCLSSFDSI